MYFGASAPGRNLWNRTFTMGTLRGFGPTRPASPRSLRSASPNPPAPNSAVHSPAAFGVALRRGDDAEVVDDVGRLAERLAARQTNLAGRPIDGDDLDEHLVALLADVLHGLDALAVELADVHEPVRPREDLDEGAELGEALDDAHVVLAHLGLGREALDDVDGLLNGDAVGRRDVDRAVVLDLDGHARLRRDAADGLAAGADDLADLGRLDVQRVDARRD